MKQLILIISLFIMIISTSYASKTHHVYLFNYMDPKIHKIFPTINKVKRGDIVYVSIDSPGGHLSALFKIAYLREQYRKKGVKFKTYVRGSAQSAAAIIYMMGDIRTKNTYAALMFHRPRVVNKGKLKYTFCNTKRMTKRNWRESKQFKRLIYKYGVYNLLKRKGKWTNYNNCRDVWIYS